MARVYDFVFVGPEHQRVSIRGYGQTTRGAERNARDRMAKDLQLESTRSYRTITIKFAGRE